MPIEHKLPDDAPVMLAWEAHKNTEEYTNSKRWAYSQAHLEGSLWALFFAGFRAGQIAVKHEITDEQIKRMVARFLHWRLPENFNPDGGVSFQKIGNEGTPHAYVREPSGTNLLDAIQAEVMIRHLVEGILINRIAREEPTS